MIFTGNLVHSLDLKQNRIVVVYRTVCFQKLFKVKKLLEISNCERLDEFDNTYNEFYK